MYLMSNKSLLILKKIWWKIYRIKLKYFCRLSGGKSKQISHGELSTIERLTVTNLLYTHKDTPHPYPPQSMTPSVCEIWKESFTFDTKDLYRPLSALRVSQLFPISSVENPQDTYYGAFWTQDPKPDPVYIYICESHVNPDTDSAESYPNFSKYSWLRSQISGNSKFWIQGPDPETDPLGTLPDLNTVL